MQQENLTESLKSSEHQKNWKKIKKIFLFQFSFRENTSESKEEKKEKNKTRK